MINIKIILVSQLILIFSNITTYTLATQDESKDETSIIPFPSLLKGMNSTRSNDDRLPYKVSNYSREQISPNFFGDYPPDALLFQKMITNKDVLDRLKKETDLLFHPLFVFGQTGTGKSTLVHQIASKSKAKLYTIDYKGIPSKFQLQLLVKDLKIVSKKALGGEELKILYLQDINSDIPIWDLADEEDFSPIFDRFFIVASSNINPDNFDEMEMVELSQFFFKAQIEQPTHENQIQIIKKILQSKTHTIQDEDITTILKEFNSFDGHKITTVINKAIKESVRKGRPLEKEDIIQAKRQKLTNGLTRPNNHLYL